MTHTKRCSGSAEGNAFAGTCAHPDCDAAASPVFETTTPLCGQHITQLFGEIQRGLDLLRSEERSSDSAVDFAENLGLSCPSCDGANCIWRLGDGTVRCSNASELCAFRVDEMSFWRLDRARLVEQARGREVVYYVQFRDVVKIGTTGDLHQRLQNIPHERLLAVEYGGRDVEVQRHRQFAEFRGVGEWFSLSPALEEHVGNLRSQYCDQTVIKLPAIS